MVFTEPIIHSTLTSFSIVLILVNSEPWSIRTFDNVPSNHKYIKFAFNNIMTHQTKKIVLVSTVIIIAGLMALSPSTLIGNAQGQMYANEYGYDNYYYQDDNNKYSYDKKEPKSSHVDIQKIKCVNSNINVNGIDITQIPQDNTAAVAANEGATDAANTQNGNDLTDRINFERNLVNICLNVNDNEQVKVTPPPPATLAVTKTVTCTPDTSSEAARVCEIIRDTIFPSSFTILVFGINANPSEFAGSSVPVPVTLDPGDYDVGEESPLIEQIPRIIITLNTDFSEDCKGTIEAGESKTCDITNNYSVRSVA